MAEATRPNTIFAATTDGGYIYPSVLASHGRLCTRSARSSS